MAQLKVPMDAQRFATGLTWKDYMAQMGDTRARTEDNYDGVSDADIISILGRMVKQRQESARAYEEGGRIDLAEQERQEIEIIREYLPRQMSENEVDKAVAEAIEETGACSIRDMGKVMAALKARHTGRMDFSRAGMAVKQAFR